MGREEGEREGREVGRRRGGGKEKGRWEGEREVGRRGRGVMSTDCHGNSLKSVCYLICVFIQH